MAFDKIEVNGDGERIIMIKISKDELEKAACNLLQLADVFGPMFRKLNADGRGEQDEKDVRQDLQT